MASNAKEKKRDCWELSRDNTRHFSLNKPATHSESSLKHPLCPHCQPSPSIVAGAKVRLSRVGSV